MKKSRAANSQKTITKRSMKNFTQTRWIDALRNRDWSGISSLVDVNDKTKEFTSELTKALDECSPMKKFKVRENFKPGLTQTAKLIMRERDSTRRRISSVSKEEKTKLQTKYKQLRNRAINQIQNDSMKRNGDRIAKADNEGEMWRIVNEIVKPKSHDQIIINTPEGPISEETKVADLFNKFFLNKIESLKEKIDPNSTTDPLTRIREKVANSNLKFKLKPVTVNQVKKSMKKMSKKKSKGKDGIPQDCLLLGLEVLAAPLTEVINCSINTGTVPEAWKEGIVAPILKKGDAKEMKNYRPVSCFTAASKVLEKVVCEQLTRFVEVHQVLPNNQHGFRANRSTMTALTAMKKEWIKNSEDGLLTGVLVWDLSSAFDTLDINLFLEKLKIYGADGLTIKWFGSFLCGRTQRVRIDNTLSAPLVLVSGVPQGGILSPIIFTLYTADMELWLSNSSLFNFADDTTTDFKHKDVSLIQKKLEEDANNVLSFMASNGLIANESKTEFLLLNEKSNPNPTLTEITVGSAIVRRCSSTKLLGIMIDDAQDWSVHYKAIRTSLNQRLFVIRRIARQIPRDKLINVVHSLWISKLRYGLQLCTTTRITTDETRSANEKNLQLTQNRMLRAINGSKISDKISVQSMLSKFKLLSVNQLSAQIKLKEVWKSLNCPNYPTKLEPYNRALVDGSHTLRAKEDRIFNDNFRLQKSKSSFNVDAARLWNAAPHSVRNAATNYEVKRAILALVKNLPL